MEKIYVVNELCELEQDNYMNCHGAFMDKKEAYLLAHELYEQAIEDIGGENCSSNMRVWNDNNVITISVDEVDLF